MYQYVVGGLGNQLFQYSMLHFIIKNTRQENGNIWIDRDPRADRPFLLNDLASSCSHVSRVDKPYAGFRGTIARAVSKLSVENLFPRLSILEWREQTEYNFLTHENYLEGKNKFWIGYFQNFRYVEDVWPLIKSEIFHHLNNIRLPQSLPEKYLVVHVRGGDFFQLAKTQGVLSYAYYREALLKFSDTNHLSVILVTDDLQNVNRISERINPDLILGPDDLNEWQTLKLMSNASGLIMANSTFSWWGGRIALENGCMVVLPSPWVKIDQLNIRDAFQHPSFLPSTSHFED